MSLTNATNDYYTVKEKCSAWDYMGDLLRLLFPSPLLYLRTYPYVYIPLSPMLLSAFAVLFPFFLYLAIHLLLV